MRRVRHILLFTLVMLSSLCVASLQAQSEDPLPDLPGQIAYVGSDFNIYTMRLSNQNQQALTSDAAGQSRQYQWPTWSVDGRLAYFGAFLEEEQLFLSIFISPDGSEPGIPVYSQENEIFQYAYWSPENCEAAERNCRDLAVLLSSATRGLFVEIIRNRSNLNENFTVGRGSPFYFSWSPDGNRMLWQRNQQTFEIYDANIDSVTETLEQAPGFVQAPAWSPVDDRLLLGVLSSGTLSDLIIIEDDETVELVTELDGLISYSWSPDGNYVAYRVLSEGNTFHALFVVDAVSGETIARSPVTGVISFFWSPDSRKLAYLTLASPPGSFNAGLESSGKVALTAQQVTGLTWTVLNVADSSVQRYGSFVPTRTMLYMLQYFDQFSQSHRVWSPDSNYLLYSELTANGPVINVLDTARADSVPFSIAEGIIGVWSFE